jgi:hypothetical protein
VNGQTTASVNGSTADELPQAILSGKGISLQSCIEAIGSAIASAAAGRSIVLQTADGLRLRTGFTVIIAAENSSSISTALAHILSPIKREQAKKHAAIALLDPEMHQQRLDHLRREYATFLERDEMPDPDHVAHYTGQIAALQAALRPVILVENPAPGRLTLAIEKSPNHCLLATMDDLALSSLLDNERTPRGRLDFELLNKSYNQQIFDGAFLEGVHDAPIVSSMVSMVAIAGPETVARLLLCDEPEVARFAAGCLVINLTDSAPAQSIDIAGRNQIAMWQQAVTRLVETPPEHSVLAMDSEASALMASFREEIADALKVGPGDRNRHLAQLPVLASKIALGLWAGCPDGFTTLTREHANRAIEIAKMGMRERESLLHANGAALSETEFETDCARVLGKIAAHGPISSKQLYRRIHGAKAEWVNPILVRLIETEQITKLPDGTFKSRAPTANDLKLATA